MSLAVEQMRYQMREELTVYEDMPYDLKAAFNLLTEVIAVGNEAHEKGDYYPGHLEAGEHHWKSENYVLAKSLCIERDWLKYDGLDMMVTAKGSSAYWEYIKGRYVEPKIKITHSEFAHLKDYILNTPIIARTCLVFLIFQLAINFANSSLDLRTKLIQMQNESRQKQQG